MNCLVLGGGGFIGSHLCDGLVQKGYKVRVFEKEGRNRANVNHLGEKIEWIEGDFFNPNHLRAVVHGIDVIFHLISTTLPKSSNENPSYDISSNVISTLHLLEAANIAGVRKIIFFSSGGTVYGIPKKIPITEDHPTEPICSYGIHKLMIEKYLALNYQLHGLDYAVMRVSNPFGERQLPTGSQGAIAVFLHKALTGKPIEIWGDGSIIRDYLHVTDVVSAALNLMETATTEKIFNIGSGVGLSLNDVINAIEEVIGYKVDVRYTSSRVFDVPVNILDTARAKKTFGWSPIVDFKTGIKKMINYLQMK